MRVGVATVTDACEIGSGDDAKRSYFGQGLEFRVAQEIGPLARVVGARGIERFWHPLMSCRTIRRSEVVRRIFDSPNRPGTDLGLKVEWAVGAATTVAALVAWINGIADHATWCGAPGLSSGAGIST